MPTVYMLCGPVCAGKTTFTVAMGITAQLINTDVWIEYKAREVGKTYNEVFMDNIKWAEGEMNRHLLNAISFKEPIIWDQTNLTTKVRERKMKVFDGTDYTKVCVAMVHYPSEAFPTFKDLIMSRNNRPGKIIPEKVIDTMLASYEIPAFNELGPYSLFHRYVAVNAETGIIAYDTDDYA